MNFGMRDGPSAPDIKFRMFRIIRVFRKSLIHWTP